MATPETGPSESTFSTPSPPTSVLFRTPPRHRCSWLRFSLRTFLLMLTALCIWLGVKVNQARRQKEAVEALRARGIYVNYAHWRAGANPESFDSRQELNVPAWLRSLAGDDFFQRVIAIWILPPSTDDDLVHLAALPHLECLYLSGRGNDLTDAGLAHLPRPDRLVHISAGRTFVGDGFMKRLHNAERLETLLLDSTRVTDAGLRSLSSLAKLKHLGLGRTQTGDTGLKVLRGMNALEFLHLDRTKVTDASLVYLREAKNLRFVHLDHTRVTDAGLIHLYGLPKLISISVRATEVTQEGITALKAATPSLRAVDEDLAQRPKESEVFRKRRAQ